MDSQSPSAPIPVVCNLGVFAPEQAEQYHLLRQELGTRHLEVRELPDGYALRYSPEPAVVTRLAEWIMLERLCCPFFTFTLQFGPAGGPVWLSLTGPGETKSLLRQTLEQGG